MNHEAWTERFLKRFFQEQNTRLDDERATLEAMGTDALAEEYELLSREESNLEEFEDELGEMLIRYAHLNEETKLEEN